MKLTTLITTFCLVLISFAAQAEDEIIGLWCDRMVPNAPKFNRTIEIRKNDRGKYYIYSRFADGSSKFDRVEIHKETTFYKPDSPSQSMYMINSSNQSLALWDKEGHIRDALPVAFRNAQKVCLGK
jgi:hypothetical protein